MADEILKKTNVPLYFDNGVDEKVLIGTATIEPDGEVTMQIDRNDFVDGEEIAKAVGDSEHWGTVEKLAESRRPEIWAEPNNEVIWVKRRTY